MNTKPQFRGEIETDLREIIKKLVKQVAFDGAFRSCINCVWWIDKTEQCQKAKARPPAKVIALGCELWEDTKSIPF